MSISNAINQHELPIAAATADNNTPASNTNAVITYASAGAGKSNVISGVGWSYSGTPTGGRLTVEDGSGTIVFDVDVTAGGPGFIPFTPPKKGSAATALIITLYAGGSGIQGKVNALAAWTEYTSGV